MVRIDGTEYQIVIPESLIQRASSMGKRASSGGTRTIAAPACVAANKSKTDRSKCRGAWLESRSLSRTSNSSTAQSTNASAFRWESITPFGTPVDPDV